MPSAAGGSPSTPINAEMTSPACGFSGSGWWAHGPVTYLKVDDGYGGTINNIVIYGANGNPDRALGYGGGPGPGSFGAVFSNNIANPITQFLISYTGEQWWNGPIRGSGLDKLAFEYSTNATNLTSGTWTAVPALDFYSLNINTANYGPIDGNNPANKTNLTATIPGLNIPSGKTFFVRWRAMDSSYDDGLAVDDFSLTPLAASGGPLHHYQFAASSPQNQGLPFAVTVTARDASNVMVSTNPPTVITLTSSGSVLFDGNGNGTFGESGDDQGTILNGYCTVSAKDDTVQTVTITAADANTITGTSSYIVINAYVVRYNRIGILWTSWDPYHYQDYVTYINTMIN